MPSDSYIQMKKELILSGHTWVEPVKKTSDGKYSSHFLPNISFRRLDYFVVSNKLAGNIVDCYRRPLITGSEYVQVYYTTS